MILGKVAGDWLTVGFCDSTDKDVGLGLEVGMITLSFIQLLITVVDFRVLVY